MKICARGKHCCCFDLDQPQKLDDSCRINGSTFIALRDAPGICPGANWQLVASRGSRGPRGERGRAVTIVSWEINRNYIATPIMSDGSAGATLDLHALFQAIHFRCRGLTELRARER